MSAIQSGVALTLRSTLAIGTAPWLVLCLCAVLLMPAWVLLAGPLLLGVPHIVSELRIFARRIKPAPLALIAILSPLAAMVLLRLGEQFGGARPSGSDVMLGCAALLAAALLRSGTTTDRVTRTLVVLGFSAVALHDTWLTTLLLAHLHNLVAVVVLIAWAGASRHSRDLRVLVFGIVGGVVLLCFAAPPASAALFDGLLPGTTTFLTGVRMALAPMLPAEAGHRLVLVYAFAQLMHYAIWLVWMPKWTRTDAVHTVRRSQWMVSGAILAMMVLPLVSMVNDPIAVRDQYLALSSFHGWLELAVLAWCGLRSDAH